jgi:glycerol kinase
MSGKYILALDQGTTSCRAILFDATAGMQHIGISQKEFEQHYPQPGWVEHDANEIWQVQLEVMQKVVAEAGIHASQIAAIGITNQRETTVVWNRHTGKPIHPAIVWQDRRTAGICDDLKARGQEEHFKQRTGLVLDAYFSGPKVQWILDHVDGARALAEAGDLLFGTMDSWLIWKLTSGKSHVTDPSNASRTLLYDLHSLQWDANLCEWLHVPLPMLPQVKDSNAHFGDADPQWLGAAIPIHGVAGDQQAALFGQGCHQPGMVKNTYGTGCFMLMNIGEKPVLSKHGLLTTVAWTLGGKTAYALEGSVFVAGAAIQWLRDGLGLLSESGESEQLAEGLPDNGGVYMVPAFTGLGAPWWDMYAKGLIMGLTRGTTKAHLARAALEAMAYQTRDVTSAMEADSGRRLSALRADGGATQNAWLMQFQADMLGVPVQVPAMAEATAMGAALLAANGVGISLQSHTKQDANGIREFLPKMDRTERELLYQQWLKAVAQTRLH